MPEITKMKFYLGLLTLPLFVACVATHGKVATFETEKLVIRDTTGDLTPKRFEKFVEKVDSTLAKILQFWSVDPRVHPFGKIIVEYEHPFPKTNCSFLYLRKESDQRVRVVRVLGGAENPHQLAHKLTNAVFLNPDKLIRNLIGEASEMRFGNPLSFPMCGFDTDCWVLALLQTNSYIPLTTIGTDHSDWGMEIHNNVPRVRDRARQHACYAEAGSFGEFLINTYGIKQIKQFNRLSKIRPRPWEEIFGISLEQLEARWLEALQVGSGEKEEQITTLVKLLKKNPVSACFSAQDLTRDE